MDKQRPDGYPKADYPTTPDFNPRPMPPQPKGQVEVINHTLYLRGKSPKQPRFTGREKIIWGSIAAGMLIVALIVFSIVSLVRKGEAPAGDKITQAYDSPVGLLSAFQEGGIKSGSFKLTSGYVTDGDFTREGNFIVEDGRVSFDMIPDVTTVNELIKSLSAKSGQPAYNESEMGATQGVAYDFASLLGYYALYDKNAHAFGGFIPQVETAKADPDKVADSKLYTLGSACDAALNDVKAKTGTNLNTRTLSFDISNEGTRKKATISYVTRQAIDKSVVAFFDSCFDLTQPAAADYKKFADNMREHTTASPDFTYWQEGDKSFLIVSATGEGSPFGRELRFEFTNLSRQAKERTGETASYREKRNLFGLAYSVCRAVPVVAQDAGFSYRFLAEDTSYVLPGESDSGYYCTTLNTPKQYRPPTSMTLQQASRQSTFTGTAIDSQRAVHDLLFKIEKYNLDNKRYPAQTEFTALVGNNMGSLTGAARGLIDNKTLRYDPLPQDCIGNCTDFALTFTPGQDLELKSGAYKL